MLDAATGQEAVNVATHFDKGPECHRAILTKLDGDARGGAALSFKSVVGKPSFMGVGESPRTSSRFIPSAWPSVSWAWGDGHASGSGAAEAGPGKGHGAGGEDAEGPVHPDDFLSQPAR